MQWPEHYPDSCPPNTAKHASGNVYRFIEKEHQSPQDEDFKSWKELHPERDYEEKECQACGLSIYTSLDEARRVAKLVPRLRKMKIAEAVLKKDSGKMENTPSNVSKDHFTWWIAKNISKPCSLFKIVS